MALYCRRNFAVVTQYSYIFLIVMLELKQVKLEHARYDHTTIMSCAEWHYNRMTWLTLNLFQLFWLQCLTLFLLFQSYTSTARYEKVKNRNQARWYTLCFKKTGTRFIFSITLCAVDLSL